MRFNYKGLLKKSLTIILCVMLAAGMFLVSACKQDGGTPQTSPTPTATATPTPSPTVEPIVKNANFEEFYDTSFPKTPKSWTSFGESFDNKTASLSKSKYGIISGDEDKFNENKDRYGGIDMPENLATDKLPGEDEYVIMLYNEQPSAIKYRSQSITLPQSSYARLSVYVMTLGLDPYDKDNPELYDYYGASINLSGMTAPVYVNGIDTGGNWEVYEFYLEGSPTSSKTIYLELGLGSGSPADSRGYTKGHAFFDKVEMEFINRAEYAEDIIDKNIISTDISGDPVYDSADDFYFYADENLSDVTPYRRNRVNVKQSASTSFAFSYVNNINIETFAFEDENGLGKITPAQIINSFVPGADDGFGPETVTSGMATVGGAKFESDLTNYPFTSSGVYYMENKIAATQGIKTREITIPSYADPEYAKDTQPLYTHYRISVFVKTSDFVNNGLNIGLFNDNEIENIQPTWFNNIDTTTYNLTEEQLEEPANRHNKWSGWTEYVFYVEANPFKEVKLWLEFWLGPKNVQNKLPVNFTMGYALFSEFSVQKITPSDYNSASSGDRVKTGIKLYTTKSPGIANSGFNAFAELGIDKKPVYPMNWKGYYGGYKNLPGNSEATFVTNYNTEYGIINKNYLSEYSFNSALSLTENDLYPADALVSAPNSLLIYNKEATAYGFVSQYKTMSAESYYKVSVMVKVMGSAKAYIYLTNSDGVLKHTVQENDAEVTTDLMFVVDETGGDWVEYQFYIRTGELTKDFYLEIWNGARDGSELSAGAVLFDDAVMLSISEKSFNDADGVLNNLLKLDYDGIDVEPEESPEPTPTVTPTPQPEEEEPYQFPWGLLTTSLIAFALLFVMVVLMLRRMKKSKLFRPKKVKAQKPSYSRDRLKKILPKTEKTDEYEGGEEEYEESGEEESQEEIKEEEAPEDTGETDGDSDGE